MRHFPRTNKLALIVGGLVSFSVSAQEQTNTECTNLQTTPTVRLEAAMDASQRLTQSCNVIENHGEKPIMNGKVSAFWGYDFIGVDLARKAIEESKFPLTSAKLATPEQVNVTDLLQGSIGPSLVTSTSPEMAQVADHGTRVASIIAGKVPYGIALKPEFDAVGAQFIVSSGDDDAMKLANQLASAHIKIFQTSWGTPKDSAAKIFDEKGIISVRHAGNSYPMKDEELPASKNTIIVGQLSAMGGMESTSSNYDGVTIAAPGRVYSMFQGKSKLFGGTSAAQPVVTGCLANVVSLLPDLSPVEAKELIIRTAIPTLNSKEALSQNGSGTLNCLKLAKVALKLKPNWPASRSRIAGDPSLYDFRKEAKDQRDAAETLKPVSTSQNSCQAKAYLDVLRSSFLLDPTEPSARDKIASLYEKSEVPGNALAYRSLGGISDQDLIKIANDFQGTDLQADAIRMAGERGGPAKLFEDGLKSDDALTVMLAAEKGLGKLTPSKIQESLVHLVSEDKLDSWTIPYFMHAYFEQAKLSTSPLLNVCKKNMKTWVEDDYRDELIICLMFAEKDPKSGVTFVREEMKSGPPMFAEKMRNLSKSGNFKVVEEALKASQ